MGETTCFVSHRFDVDVSTLTQILLRYGIEVSRLDSIIRADSSPDALDDAIRGATFFCAVVTGFPTESQIFEIGLAKGIGKPVLIIADKGVRFPLTLAGLTVIHGSLNDRQALEYTLDQFLEKLSLPRRDRAPSSRRTPSLLHESMYKWFMNQPINSGAELESAIERVFRSVPGVVVSRLGETLQTEADMALWIDGLETIVGCPLLCVVKHGYLTEQRLLESERSLAGHIGGGTARIGIVLYYDLAHSTGHFDIRSPEQAVLRFDVRSLFKRMVEEPLSSIILSDAPTVSGGH